MSCKNWFEQLQAASFKDVPFEVDGSLDTTQGWDAVVREYPFQDIPTIQPMGETTHEFRVSAYVVGKNYAKKRDALAKALRGEGLLSHPTLGYMRVWVNGPFSFREAIIDEGNVARFDITFIKAEERRYPQIGLNLKFKILDDIKSAIDTANAWLGAALSFTGAGFIKNTALGQIADIVTAAEELAGTIHSGKDSFNKIKQFIRNLGSRAEALFDNPSALADHVEDVFRLPQTIDSARARAGFDSLQTLFNYALNAPQSPFNTPSRMAERANSESLARFIKIMAMLKACHLLQEFEFTSYREALDIRKLIHKQFKSLLLDTAKDYELHNSLQTVHADILANITESSQSYGRVSTYTPTDVQPVIYISYRLYGSTDYADEIYYNNPAIKHPLLPPAGKPLMVISHV